MGHLTEKIPKLYPALIHERGQLMRAYIGDNIIPPGQKRDAVENEDLRI